MLGRIQELNQLYIVGSLPDNKITTDKEALSQLAVLKAKSLNMNPPVWEKAFNQSCKILYHNIHSLKDKIQDIRADLLLPFSDLIILGETWLETDEDNEDSLSALCQNLNKDNNINGSTLYLNDYELHLNGHGKGKGLATYFKEKSFQSNRISQMKISR